LHASKSGIIKNIISNHLKLTNYEKSSLVFRCVFICVNVTFGQVQEGDIKFVQQLFGVEKAALVKEYMNLTPQ